MQLNLADLFGNDSNTPSAVAVGAFDGVHRGHQLLLRTAVKYAKEHGCVPAAVTFDPLPLEFLTKQSTDQRILLPDEQLAMIKAQGIERVVVLPFNDALMNTTPEEFVSVMAEKLRPRCLFMGTDFTLGRGRSGTPEVLAELGKRYGFDVEVLDKFECDGDVVSATRIRGLLREGKVEEAERLLGYPYFFSGVVEHGEARGRTLGFPTLNIRIPEEKIHLPHGVYAAYSTVDGVRYPAVADVGIRPTFGDLTSAIAEVHLLHTDGDFYDKTVKTEFIAHLRAEQRFDSIDALVAQIRKDAGDAEKVLVNSQ